ncbi:MAG TPA: DUF6378 domain-containing protein, partial [Leptospiraceae bacterium]|nr:DUF6378 domain-containing protein [Leptospiraceae bacterium]
MRENHTKEELDKLKKYFNSLGENTLIDVKKKTIADWGKPLQIEFLNFDSNNLDYRIANDPHWELREKWILLDFQLPIEFYDEYDKKWVDIKTPAWWNDIKYREKPIDLQKTFEETFVKLVTEDFLDEAIKILYSRGEEYEKENKEENSFLAVASAFNAITGKNLSPAEVALLLQILKDVRQWAKPRFHKDSAVDCIN